MKQEDNRKILIVDDQASIREDFKKILGVSGPRNDGLDSARSAFFGDAHEASSSLKFDLTTASQGEEGVDIIAHAVEDGDPFALAFVDVRMPPGIDGVRAIRSFWEHDPDLQVVICTAYSDYSFEQIVQELGHSDKLLILKKPFDPVEVRQLAGALTEKWNTTRRERRQMDELREARARAESANRAKTEFLANVSHEIRTPMNALLGYIDLMSDPETTPEDRMRYGRTIQSSGEHLLSILNDILDISNIEASRIVVNAADLCPFDLVYDVASLMRARATDADLDLSIRVDGAIPEIIESDLVRVRQILVNLVGNAIKFTREGSIQIVVHLDANESSDHRYICFDVVDTGVGIEPEKLRTIFEAFSQGDTSHTREYGGTGLGLTIAKRLALLLGGDVKVTSRVGRGSTFTLRLYAGELGRALLREYTADDCCLDRGGSKAYAEPEAVDVSSIRIDGTVLVVEDVKFNQMLLAALMRKCGATVELASNGQEGYEAAMRAAREGRPYDLVLLDMQMPVMDGYEATRKLRADGYRWPIVALTAHAMAGDRKKCLDAGCDDYATKPIDKRVLLPLCRNLIELERAGAALPSEKRTTEVDVDFNQ